MNINITEETKRLIKQVNIRKYLEDMYDCVFNGTNCKCPHPDHEDTTPSFSVWQNSEGFYYWCCHGCHCGKADLHSNDVNYGTDIISLVRWLSDYKGSPHILSFQEAAIAIMDYAGIPYDATNNKYYLEYKKKKAVASLCNKSIFEETSIKAHKYLIERGLSDSDIMEWLIGYNGERITFPLLDKANNVVGFSKRIVGSSKTEAKYVNSSNSDVFNKSSYLYGCHKLNQHLNYVYVTEGQMDVIAAYKYGLKNVVAALGTAFTENHISFLRANFSSISKIIFIYDGDEAGRKALNRSAKLARSNGYSVSCVILPEGKDLFDYAIENKEEAPKKISQLTQYYFLYEVSEFTSEYSRTLYNAKLKVLENFTPVYNNTFNVDEKRAIKTFLLSEYGINIA